MAIKHTCHKKHDRRGEYHLKERAMLSLDAFGQKNEIE